MQEQGVLVEKRTTEAVPVHNMLDIVLGRPIYTADQIPEDALWVRAVRSRHPHARVTRIQIAKALQTTGVVAVLTAKDIPGQNLCSTMVPDRPFLASEEVRCLQDPLALVVGTSEGAAARGVEEVEVDYEPLPAVTNVLDAVKPGAPRLSEQGNVLRHYKVRKGDVEIGFRESDIILEQTYTTPSHDPAPMETECAFAVPRPDGRIVITGSIQNPFYAREGISKILGLPPDRIDLVVPAIGGTFGGKSDEAPWDVCSMAALAALKTGKTAACVYKRDESILAHSRRHASHVKWKLGATKDGLLKAAEVTFYLDAGAYASAGPLVLSRALVHATGPYQFPNVRVDGYLVYTNNLTAGSFRGFGNPQVHFAAESHMDLLAEKLGVDPIDLRRKNVLRSGSTTATGQVLDGPVSLEECLLKVADRIKLNPKQRPLQGPVKRGRGFALVYHGNSLGPEGEDKARAEVVAHLDGTFGVRTGLTEYGTWSTAGFARIAASFLGVSSERVATERIETDRVPDSGGTFASRSTLMGGNAVRLAAIRLRERIQAMAAERSRSVRSEAELVEFITKEMDEEVSETAEFTLPPLDFDPEKGYGTPYLQYTYGAVGVDLDVNVETGNVHLNRVVAAFDVGTVINRNSVVSQIEGGVTQGIGFGLSEELIVRDNQVLTSTLADLLLPTSIDVPPIEVMVLENPSTATPLGTRSIGEPPIVGPAPAIANAVHNAIGVRVCSLPVTAEKILQSLNDWQS
ncbi:MAG TPA: xanthine dehydrogenase family protein molybdopterin-binding subunit [Nitrososphaerales archaeon]|nr:xanthine dehydrogenase family protein molybdopterin-binding subunit [Nitrososphaerales archaeon]